MGPEFETFLGPEMTTNEASAIWLDPKKLRIQGPPLQMVQIMDIARFKIIESKSEIKNRYIGNFMYMSF